MHCAQTLPSIDPAVMQRPLVYIHGAASPLSCRPHAEMANAQLAGMHRCVGGVHLVAIKCKRFACCVAGSRRAHGAAEAGNEPCLRRGLPGWRPRADFCCLVSCCKYLSHGLGDLAIAGWRVLMQCLVLLPKLLHSLLRGSESGVSQ